MTTTATTAPAHDTVPRPFDARKYIHLLRQRAATGLACPECGGPLVHGEGCALCPVCGYSNCG